MFSKTLVKTRSSAWNVRGLTHLLYRFIILCWYKAIRITATSWSSFVISKSLMMVLVLVFPRISVLPKCGHPNFCRNDVLHPIGEGEW